MEKIGKGNSYPLPVGVQTGSAVMEIRVEVLHMKTELPYDPADHFGVYV